MFDFLRKRSGAQKLDEGATPEGKGRKQGLHGMEFDEQTEELSALNPKNAIYKARLGMTGRHDDVMRDAADIPNQDIIMEQLAHRGAYKGLDPTKLANWGYEMKGAAEDPESGFRAVLYMPTKEALEGKTPRAKVITATHGGAPPPVVAFRGTDPKKGKRGISDDVNREGVGTYALASNKAKIAELMAAGGGSVVVTGHSLGGAMAQLAACTFPGMTRSVVTFQSPGIPKKEAEKLDAYNASVGDGDKVESTHYRAEGDIVHSAGEAATRGTVFEFESVGVGNGLDHMQYSLARLAAARGNLITGVTSRSGKAAQDRLVRVNKTTTDQEKGDWKNKVSEWGRKAMLGFLRDDDMEPYVAMWKKVEEMCTSGAFSLSYVLAVIKDSDQLTEVQKVKMRDNVSGLYADVMLGQQQGDQAPS